MPHFSFSQHGAETCFDPGQRESCAEAPDSGIKEESMELGRYWIALFNEVGDGVERELARCDRLQSARKRYKEFAADHPDRIVILCDRATVLVRSDRRVSSAAA
jgi:hypothetical protein